MIEDFIKQWKDLIVGFLIIIGTISLAIFSNHAPKGNSDIEGTIDKIIQKITKQQADTLLNDIQIEVDLFVYALYGIKS